MTKGGQIWWSMGVADSERNWLPVYKSIGECELLPYERKEFSSGQTKQISDSESTISSM